MEKLNKKVILAIMLGLIVSFAFTIVVPSFVGKVSAKPMTNPKPKKAEIPPGEPGYNPNTAKCNSQYTSCMSAANKDSDKSKKCSSDRDVCLQ